MKYRIVCFKMFFLRLACTCEGTYEFVWPRNASLYPSLTCVHLRLLGGPFAQGFRGSFFYWAILRLPWGRRCQPRRRNKGKAVLQTKRPMTRMSIRKHVLGISVWVLRFQTKIPAKSKQEIKNLSCLLDTEELAQAKPRLQEKRSTKRNTWWHGKIRVELVRDKETDLPKYTGKIQENGQFSDVDEKILYS